MEIAVQRDHLALLLTYSVRYALGRRTTAPSDVAAITNGHLGHLRPHELTRLRDDIRDQSRLGYGDPCDEDTWAGLVAQLDERIGR